MATKTFADEIDQIYHWERFDTILNALYVSVIGFLYVFGKTKISMTLNISRLFLFRIPILLILMKVPAFFNVLGIQSVGIAMCLSNGLVGLCAGIVAFFTIKKEMKKI